jgi:hypothetical protein
MLSLVLDVLLVVLLAVTIGYAVTLNKRLSVLRQDKADLERLAGRFAEATARADESVGRLKGTADKLGEILQERITKGQALRDDLAFLLERGEGIADRLEGAVRNGRAKVAAEPARERPRPLVAEAADELPARSEAERELLKALRAVR